MDKPRSPDLLRRVNSSSRPANYLSAGRTCPYDDPLLKKTLKLECVKSRLLGQDVKEARWVLKQLPELGISINIVRRQPEDEGVEKLNEPFDKLMETLAQTSPRHLTRESWK